MDKMLRGDIVEIAVFLAPSSSRGKTLCQKILNYKMVFAYSLGKYNARFIDLVEKKIRNVIFSRYCKFYIF